MLGQDLRKPLGGTFTPARDQNAFAAGAQRSDMPDRVIEHIGIGIGALLGKIAPGLRARVVDAGLARLRRCKGGEVDHTPVA